MKMAGNGLYGKKLSVFFDDGEKITRKQGICTENADDFLILDNRDAISKTKIIRVEVLI